MMSVFLRKESSPELVEMVRLLIAAKADANLQDVVCLYSLDFFLSELTSCQLEFFFRHRMVAQR